MYRLILIAIIALGTLVGSVVAQDAENVELVGRCLNDWDRAWDVVVLMSWFMLLPNFPVCKLWKCRIQEI